MVTLCSFFNGTGTPCNLPESRQLYTARAKLKIYFLFFFFLFLVENEHHYIYIIIANTRTRTKILVSGPVGSGLTMMGVPYVCTGSAVCCVTKQTGYSKETAMTLTARYTEKKWFLLNYAIPNRCHIYEYRENFCNDKNSNVDFMFPIKRRLALLINFEDL
jgi:hypothetical protein